MKVLEDGNFERAASWPLLTDIQGRLIFEGASMTVLADSAKTNGATVTKTRADIPNLSAGDNTRLIINGNADAELQKFFDYVQAPSRSLSRARSQAPRQKVRVIWICTSTFRSWNPPEQR